MSRFVRLKVAGSHIELHAGPSFDSLAVAALSYSCRNPSSDRGEQRRPRQLWQQGVVQVSAGGAHGKAVLHLLVRIIPFIHRFLLK